MIGRVLGDMLLREVPAALHAGVQTGALKVSGSVVRSVVTGRVVGHLQETSALTRIAPLTLAAGGNALSPIGMAADVVGQAASVVQNEQIKAGIALVKTLQGASLALGAMGIGVSVAGFAVLSRRIGAIEAKVDALGDRLDAVACSIHTLRRDMLADLFTRLRTLVDQMDEGWSLADPAKQWGDVAVEAHTLANLFNRRAVELLDRDEADPELLDPLLEALALAASTRISARLASGDDLVARRAAEDTASVLAGLEARMSTGTMLFRPLRACAAEPGTSAWSTALAAAAERYRTSVRTARAREIAAVSMMSTLEELAAREIGGRAWLEAARAEDTSPFLFLPTADWPMIS